MTEQKPQTSPTRREFFKTAGLGTAAAAGAAVIATDAAPAAAKTAPEGQGYRETAHVKRYYDLATKF